MRPKAYTGERAPGRATITLLEWMNAAPDGKRFAAAQDGESVLVVARGYIAAELRDLITANGGKVQKATPADG